MIRTDPAGSVNIHSAEMSVLPTAREKSHTISSTQGFLNTEKGKRRWVASCKQMAERLSKQASNPGAPSTQGWGLLSVCPLAGTEKHTETPGCRLHLRLSHYFCVVP
jgi:hypothetical protein